MLFLLGAAHSELNQKAEELHQNSDRRSEPHPFPAHLCSAALRLHRGSDPRRDPLSVQDHADHPEQPSPGILVHGANGSF